MRVAIQASAGAIQPSSDRAVTFGGAAVVTVSRGQDALSDPVDLALPALAHLAVTVHVPEGAGASTIHDVGHQTAYFLRGDATMVAVFPAGEPKASRHFLTGVEVEAGRGAGTVVVLGDSMTDGVGSTPDGNARWPDALATRLQAHPSTASIAVVNAGIAGTGCSTTEAAIRRPEHPFAIRARRAEHGGLALDHPARRAATTSAPPTC